MNLPPALADWFAARGWAPRRHQLAMLDEARAGRHALLVAATGAGKTLAGFLPSLADLIEDPTDGLHTLYVSPLKALAVDVQRNLITPIAGATKAEAEDKMALIEKLPLEIDALSLLAEALNFNFAAKDMDEPLTTEELQGMQGMLGMRDGVLKLSGKPNPSARDFVKFSGRGQTQDAIVGGPKEIADRLEEMFVERGCDGFVIAATYVPGSYADFVKHVVPELQRRGLFHKDYAGNTLRENLGLPRPAAGAWKIPAQTAAE